MNSYLGSELIKIDWKQLRGIDMLTCLLWIWIFLSAKAAGIVSRAPKLTISKAPTLRTRGILLSIIASNLDSSQAMTPPTIWSATSVVVTSSTPYMHSNRSNMRKSTNMKKINELLYLRHYVHQEIQTLQNRRWTKINSNPILTRLI